MRDRIGSVNSTRKITEAMKMVAAAKVRKAQDAVINSRPFSESLVKILFAINTKLAGQEVDVPLCQKRTVKSVRPKPLHAPNCAPRTTRAINPMRDTRWRFQRRSSGRRGFGWDAPVLFWHSVDG
jgi:hypothetical protein